MTVIDDNGTSFWNLEAIQQRYKLYAQRYGIAPLSKLSPREHTEKGKHWIYPLMDQVIEGIKHGDPACAEIGVEFIEDSASFPFGKSESALSRCCVPAICHENFVNMQSSLGRLV